jgi:flagellar hook-basal body complex protein FliE
MNGIPPLGRLLEPFRTGTPLDPTPSSGFADALRQAVAEVNSLQQEAGAEIRQLVTGESEDLHKTLLAVQRSDIAFQLMLEVRNKVVQAYQEIMRIQV